MKFLNILKTIGEDIIKGIEIAIPIIGPLDPQLAPILEEIAIIVAAIEKSGVLVTPAQLSAIIQATATAAAVRATIK